MNLILQLKRHWFFFAFFIIFFGTSLQLVAQTLPPDTPATITWPFNLGTAGQLATYVDETLWKPESVTVASNLSYNGTQTGAENGITFTRFTPGVKNSSRTANDIVSFNVTPLTGLTFDPTNISFNCERFGTGGGLIDVIWKSSNGVSTVITTGIKPDRSASTNVGNETYIVNIDVSSMSIPTSDGVSSLEIYIYNLDPTKNVGIANIEIQGKLNGTPADVNQYTVTTAASPSEGGVIVSDNPSTVDEGTVVNLTANANFGYEFAEWQDNLGATVSTNNPFQITVTDNVSYTAVFNQLTTYALDLVVDGGGKNYMVNISPAGTMVNGSRMYLEGTNVTLTASGNPILNFSNWGTGETNNVLAVTMNGNKSITATYNAADYIVGWDFYDDVINVDFSSNVVNDATTLVLRNAAGATSGGLNFSYLSNPAGWYGKNCRINWNSLANKFYYQIKINASDYTDISVQAAMLTSYSGYPVQKCEYSINGTDFTTIGTYNTGTLNTWVDGSFNLPADANNNAEVYIRWIPDYTTTPIGSGNDGTSISAIYVYGTPSIFSTTWNGSTWSNGTPDSTLEAIIDGDYSTTTNGTISAKKLTVNATKTLIINSGTNVTVQNELINNGSVIVESNANLVQVNNTTNTGNVVVNRNSSALSRLDYTLWSSPVAGQNLATFSPLTSQSPSRFYNYDSATNLYSAIASPTTTNFTAGAGCLIRMPNTAATAPTTETFNGQFTGVPNNGDIPFTLVDGGAGLRYNLVGNPYPSPITMSVFVADNANITGTLYFWRKTNGAGTAYCTWTGGVFTTNGNAQSVNPAGVIQTGQGFIVEANGSGTALTFKNTQRAANTAGQFFKTKQVATPSRIWLNATNTAGDFSQTAVNYTTDATPGVDAFDGKYINDSAFALTSNINNEEYIIQGRPAFDASDVVPLNFKTGVAGDYTIAIDHADGVFAAGQDVVLVDNTTGTETSLTNSSYTFTAAAGTASSRFSMKYQKTLGTNKSVFSDNNVTVYRNKGTLYINAGDATIANIKVYDVQGKLVAELKNVRATSATNANLKPTNQVLVVKITSQDNKVVTKKVVN